MEAELPSKKRHWVLTVWLIWGIIANVMTIMSFVFGKDLILRAKPDMPDWAFVVMPAISATVLAGIIAILKWKKWGFWIHIPICITGFVINFGILHSGLPGSILGLMNPLILYAFLKIGREKAAWPQLG